MYPSGIPKLTTDYCFPLTQTAIKMCLLKLAFRGALDLRHVRPKQEVDCGPCQICVHSGLLQLLKVSQLLKFFMPQESTNFCHPCIFDEELVCRAQNLFQTEHPRQAQFRVPSKHSGQQGECPDKKASIPWLTVFNEVVIYQVGKAQLIGFHYGDCWMLWKMGFVEFDAPVTILENKENGGIEIVRNPGKAAVEQRDLVIS